GLIWVLMSGRKLRETEETDVFPPSDTRPDPGSRANQSRTIVAPPPIAADHLISLQKSIQIGSLEVTPLEIAKRRVSLRRMVGNEERKSGGKDALVLKLQLKNVSSDAVFAPLDESFLRERERDAFDSLIETSDGERIEMYPLAVISEWGIEGQ